MDALAGLTRSAGSPDEHGRRTPTALALHSAIWGRLGRWRPGRALLDSFPVRRLARLWLQRRVVAKQQSRPDDVAVVIGIRDRNDHRLELALRSLRDQTHPADQVQILVVDYGSEPISAARTVKMCEQYGATCLRAEVTGVWSRGRCLNIGIRQVTTKYLMTSDVDLLFSPGFLAEAVAVLRDSPLSVVCSPMLDLSEDSTGLLRDITATGAPLRLREWKRSTVPRRGWEYHPSVTVTHSAVHRLIRGYDEYYELWGAEDDDLLQRLIRVGLDVRVVHSGDVFYLHQWHPRFENLAEDGREGVIEANRRYFRRVFTIVRNSKAWGGGASR